MEKQDIASYAAEFAGTFMLVLAVGCNVLSNSGAFAVTSIACTLMVAIYCFAGVSGAHLNPAVTASLLMSGKMKDGNGKNDIKKAGMYVMFQVLGGIWAGGLYGVLLKDSFNLGPTEGTAWWQAALAEIFYTFMLCFVVLNVAASNAQAGKTQYYGLAIGFVVIAGGYGAGSLSGGAFNPAVAIGVDFASLSKGFGLSFFYLVFEIVGAAMAAGLFRVVRPEDFGARDTFGFEQLNKIASEFIGTFMLVLTVGLNVLNGSPAAAFSIAAALMSMIFALGDVSGAHFNPAVTVAIVAGKRPGAPETKDAAGYILAQLAGGLAGSLTYAGMYKGESFPLGPGPDYKFWQAYMAEFFFTFLLAFVVLCVATVVDKNKLTQYFGLAIGSCVTVGGNAIGAVSGGSLNPAVSFAVGLTGWQLTHIVPYMLVQLLAGYAAAVYFRVTHPDEEYVEADKQALA